MKPLHTQKDAHAMRLALDIDGTVAAALFCVHVVSVYKWGAGRPVGLTGWPAVLVGAWKNCCLNAAGMKDLGQKFAVKLATLGQVPALAFALNVLAEKRRA